MKTKLLCLIDWLNENRSDAQAWQILLAVANETLKRADSADPAQREFDVLDIAQACQPEKDWDYDAAKRWFSRAGAKTYLEARRSELNDYFRARGHAQALDMAQRPSTGRYRAQWYLYAYDLEANEPDEERETPGESNPPGVGSDPVGDALVYEFTPPGEVKPSLIGGLLLGKGFFPTRSFRGLMWALLSIGSILLMLTFLYLFWAMRWVQRPMTTGDLVTVLMLIAGAWAFWRFLVRPLVWLLEDRIVPAGDLLVAWNEPPAHLDLNKDGQFRYIRLVRYGGVCPICAGTIELRYGTGPNSRRLFGCCAEAPQDHVFTFDRVRRVGRRVGL